MRKRLTNQELATLREKAHHASHSPEYFHKLMDPFVVLTLLDELIGYRSNPNVVLCIAAETERCAEIADEEAAAFDRNMALAVHTGSNAGAGDAIGSRSTAERIAFRIRATLPCNA